MAITNNASIGHPSSAAVTIKIKAIKVDEYSGEITENSRRQNEGFTQDFGSFGSGVGGKTLDYYYPIESSLEKIDLPTKTTKNAQNSTKNAAVLAAVTTEVREQTNEVGGQSAETTTVVTSRDSTTTFASGKKIGLINSQLEPEKFGKKFEKKNTINFENSLSTEAIVTHEKSSGSPNVAETTETYEKSSDTSDISKVINNSEKSPSDASHFTELIETFSEGSDYLDGSGSGSGDYEMEVDDDFSAKFASVAIIVVIISSLLLLIVLFFYYLQRHDYSVVPGVEEIAKIA